MDHFQRIYASQASAYHQMIAAEDADGELRAVLAEFAPRPGERLLDLGSGTGRIPLSLRPATPAGAVWGFLPDAVRRAGLPDGTRYAINHEWTLPGAPLRDGDEVALVVPGSGG